MMERLCTAVPQPIKAVLPRAWETRMRRRHQSRYESLPSWPTLTRQLRRYQVDQLLRETPAAFRDQIDAFLALSDHEMEILGAEVAGLSRAPSAGDEALSERQEAEVEERYDSSAILASTDQADIRTLSGGAL